MIVIILEGELLRSIILKEGKNCIPVMSCELVLYLSKETVIMNQPGAFRYLPCNRFIHGMHANLETKDGHRMSQLYFSSYDKGFDQFRKIRREKTILTIGDQIDDDLYLQDASLNRHHITLDFQTMHMTDSSHEGLTAINGTAVHESNFRYTDIIQILNAKIILHQDFLMINKVENLFTIMEPYRPPIGKPLPKKDERILEPSYRSFNGFPSFEEELAIPETLSGQERTPLIFAIGPALTMSSAALASGMIAFRNGLVSGREWPELLPSILLPGVMMLSALFWNPMQRRYEEKKYHAKRKKRAAAYHQYLSELTSRLRTYTVQYKKEMESAFPNPAQQLQMHREDHIWVKNSLHADWLMFRIGTGTDTIPVTIRRPFHLSAGDELSDEIRRLPETVCQCDQLPMVVPIGLYRMMTIVTEEVMSEFADFILQISTYYSVPEISMSVFCTKWQYSNYPWIRMIPYLIRPNGIRCLFYQIADIQEIRNTIEKDPASVHLFFNLSDHQFDFSDIERTVQIFITNGVTIPSNTDLLINRHDGTVQTNGTMKKFHSDVVPVYDPLIVFSKMSRRCAISAHLKERDHSFFDLYHVQSAQELKIEERWTVNKVRNGLSVPIGVDDTGQNIFLDLSEGGHGPHGLIAGMTGSGKSALIITLLLSLAIQYPPCELQFAVIDFKGGGVSHTFQGSRHKIPHLISDLSNLEPQYAERALVSFRNECERREHLFLQLSSLCTISISDLHTYQSLWFEDCKLPYIAELIIIVDEFAELKQSQPDFMRELVSLARVGRSLGIHLILSTQKPAGVIDDQIWSNSRFKIGLKVQSRQDSIELLHDEIASSIRHPGEFFLLCDGALLHGISGYAQHPSEADEGKRMVYLDHLLRHTEKNDAVIHGKNTQLQEILEQISLVKYNHSYMRPLWLPVPYPRRFLATDKPGVYGQIDDIKSGKQPPLAIDDAKDRLTLIYGIERAEKYQILLSILYALLRSAGAEDEIYIIDLLGFALTEFILFHQVIDVMKSDDMEKIGNLICHLKSRNSDAVGVCHVFITDLSGLYSLNEEWRNEFHQMFEQAQRMRSIFYAFGTASDSIPYRDTALSSMRIALVNDNIQDISAIFERNIKSPIHDAGHCMIQRNHPYPAIYYHVDKAMFKKLAEENQEQCSISKVYAIPYLPARIKWKTCHQQGIILGMDIHDYTWQVMPKNNRLIVISTYDEDWEPVRCMLTEQTSVIRYHKTMPEMDAVKKGVLLITLSEFQADQKISKSDAWIIFVGEGFNEQFIFRIREKRDIKSTEGVLFKGHSGRIIHLAE